MEAYVKKIKYKKISDIIHVVPIGDIHYGNVGCDEQRLLDLIEWIRVTPNVYWIGTGDYADCIVTTDHKRFDAESIADWVYSHKRLQDVATAQVERLSAIFKPIAKRCLGLIYGNHEGEILKRHHTDLVRALCMSLGVENLGAEAMIRLSFEQVTSTGSSGNRRSWTIHIEHGHGGGRRAGGKLNAVGERDLGYDADIFLMGHVHTKAVNIKHKIYLPTLATGYDVDGTARLKPQVRKVLECLTGAFLKKHADNAEKKEKFERGSMSYAERFGYNPVAEGTIRLDFQMSDGDVHVRL